MGKAKKKGGGGGGKKPQATDEDDFDFDAVLAEASKDAPTVPEPDTAADTPSEANQEKIEKEEAAESKPSEGAGDAAAAFLAEAGLGNDEGAKKDNKKKKKKKKGGGGESKEESGSAAPAKVCLSLFCCSL